MPLSSLYRRVLGPRFEDLAPVLQYFHGKTTPARASGHLSVQHGSSVWARLIATIWRLPREGPQQPATVNVEMRGDIEIWRRTIGGRSFVTKQWHSGALLIESLGSFSLGLEATAQQGALRLLSRRAWWCGVPIPAWLAPQVAALAQPTTQGWNVEVHVAHPWLGKIISYDGEVIPQ